MPTPTATVIEKPTTGERMTFVSYATDRAAIDVILKNERKINEEYNASDAIRDALREKAKRYKK